MKYIMVKDFRGRVFPLIFPEFLTHSEVFETANDLSEAGPLGLMSAGFVTLGQVKTYGHSESTGKCCLPADHIRIQSGDALAFLPDQAVLEAYERIKQLKESTSI